MRGYTKILASTTFVVLLFTTVCFAQTLTINRNPEIGGHVTPVSGEKHKARSSVDLVAMPVSGYRFVNWKVLEGQAQIADLNSARTTITLRSKATIVANFEQTYTLMAYVTPARSGAATLSASTGIVAGIPVNIAAASTPGHRFLNWTVPSGQAQIADANSAVTTIVLRTNATISANFQQLFSLTASPNLAGGGTVTSTAQAEIVPGTSVSVTAVPADGYRFANWTVASGLVQIADANSAATSITVASTAAITANFERLLTLKLNSSLPEGGTAKSEVQSNILAGTPVGISASPTIGYEFVNWTVASGTAAFAMASSLATTVTLSSDAIITANFQPLLTLTVAPSQKAGGTVTSASLSNISIGAPVSITAVPSSGYLFVNWSVQSGTASFANAEEAATTVTMNTDAEIIANFERVFTLTAAANPAAGGAVTPLTMPGMAEGRPVEIVASPANDYRFVNWTVKSGRAQIADAKNANTTVALSANAAITANFQQTRGTFTDSRDRQEYRWVRIGNRVWMARNLNYANPARGVHGCFYDNNSNCETYGRLYNSDAARVVCPSGWRLANDNDWRDLMQAAGGQRVAGETEIWNIAGNKLKTVRGWNSGGNGTDEFGFGALPGGGRWNDRFNALGGSGYWWSGTGTSFWVIGARGGTERGELSGGGGGVALPVRCVRN